VLFDQWRTDRQVSISFISKPLLDVWLSATAQSRSAGICEKDGGQLRRFPPDIYENAISERFEMIGDVVIHVRPAAHVVSQLLKAARYVHIICGSVLDIRHGFRPQIIAGTFAI
jgi:hypothetical protein